MIKIHNKKIIYENKLWKITAILHVNGTFSGKVINKTNKKYNTWVMHYKDRCPKISYKIPGYVGEIIRVFVKTSCIDDNLLIDAHIAI